MTFDVQHEPMLPLGDNVGDHVFGRYYVQDAGELAYYVDNGYTRPGETVPEVLPTIHVRWVVINPDFRLQGVGRSLVERMLQDYPQHQVDPGTGHEDAVAWCNRLAEIIPGLKERLLPARVWSDEDRDTWRK